MTHPYPSWRLVELTPEAAEAHDRHAYNAQPPVQLGWKPYIFRATHGAVAQFACHTPGELILRLNERGLTIEGWTNWREGVRSTYLVPSKYALPS